jgi:hypothetical protein
MPIAIFAPEGNGMNTALGTPARSAFKPAGGGRWRANFPETEYPYACQQFYF